MTDLFERKRELRRLKNWDEQQEKVGLFLLEILHLQIVFEIYKISIANALTSMILLL